MSRVCFFSSSCNNCSVSKQLIKNIIRELSTKIDREKLELTLFRQRHIDDEQASKQTAQIVFQWSDCSLFISTVLAKGCGGDREWKMRVGKFQNIECFLD
jgi:hypothetical protein